jgi:hypothetical protein
VTADIDGDFVVFLIGARFNDKLHLLRSLIDIGGCRSMKYLLNYLVAHPEKGLLGYEMGLLRTIQYWRSFEHLEALAKDTNDPHVATWCNYWHRVGRSARTGIWHETYRVKAGDYEVIYSNMPPFGLGKAGRPRPLSENAGARKRLEIKTARPSP